MARHETEMHRQRRIALEALQQIAQLDASNNFPILKVAKQIAKNAINRICEPAANGLWADRAQIDLMDRKDI